MQTASDVRLFFLAITALCTFFSVASVVLAWMLASRATRKPKKTPSPQELAAELASLSAEEKISHTLRKIDNRMRMREQRESARGARQAPPEGAPKAELWSHYGFTQAGPRFAQQQLDIERQEKH